MSLGTIASVFIEKRDSSWHKLKRSHRYSKLQSTFWGKRIEDDAQRWRESHPDVKDDDDNDIGPDCYALDLGVPRLKSSKLWVRNDYVRLYDYCTTRHGTGPQEAGEDARSVVITGQPGVGKTYWVMYAVRRRLGEQKPFLLFRNRWCFLFAKERVYFSEVESIDANCFSPFLWAFVDADSHEGVPPSLIDDTNLFIIFTTSPKSLRWKPLSKSTDLAVVVMNTWTLREVRLAAEKVHNFTEEQLDLAETNFETFGPVARNCIKFVQDPDLVFRRQSLCETMVANLTFESLRNLVLDGGVLDLEKESHAIFLVRRNDRNDVLGRVYLEPISANVATQFMTRFNKLEQLERIHLFHLFASVNESRTIAGLVYESLGQTILQEGVTLTLKPMIKTYAQPLFHWKAQSEEQKSDFMDLDNSEITVSFPPNAAIIYEGMQMPIQPNRLYVPKARNHVALDYFFQLDPNLYILQFIVANFHGIKPGIEECFAGRENIPPKAGWRFVFITPPDCEVDVKATSEVEHSLEGVTLYSAHLAIGL